MIIIAAAVTLTMCKNEKEQKNHFHLKSWFKKEVHVHIFIFHLHQYVQYVCRRCKCCCVLVRCVSPASSPLEGSGLLVSDVWGPQGPLQRLLTHADCVSNWVSAELVICDSTKVIPQSLLSIYTPYKCYQWNWVMNVHSRIIVNYIISVTLIILIVTKLLHSYFNYFNN